LITDGKHIGKKGTIEKINRDKKIAEIKSKQEKINVLLSYLMVEK
jgi:ribosomal protein S4E